MLPARRDALRLRARLYALIREFFASRGVLEVETPILSAAGNTEPNIEGFTTRFAGHVDAGARERFLRTSAEYPLKRLLADGLGDCYELGRVFRNGEAGRRHNPEFTMLEWYRVGWDHRRLAAEMVALVRAARRLATNRGSEAFQNTPSFRRKPESIVNPALRTHTLHLASDNRQPSPGVTSTGDAVRTTTYRALFEDALAIDPFIAPEAALRAPLTAFDIDPTGLTRDDWLDLLLSHCIQPRFQPGAITIIHDWPATQCSLARITRDDPPVAERFELYLGPYELANGYHELNDAAEQRARFEHDNARRRARGQRELPLDENLLTVLDAMPDCAGVALGIERLLMCLVGTDAIADVLAFPFGAA